MVVISDEKEIKEIVNLFINSNKETSESVLKVSSSISYMQAVECIGFVRYICGDDDDNLVLDFEMSSNGKGFVYEIVGC